MSGYSCDRCGKSAWPARVIHGGVILCVDCDQDRQDFLMRWMIKYGRIYNIPESPLNPKPAGVPDKILQEIENKWMEQRINNENTTE